MAADPSIGPASCVCRNKPLVLDAPWRLPPFGLPDQERHRNDVGASVVGVPLNQAKEEAEEGLAH